MCIDTHIQTCMYTIVARLCVCLIVGCPGTTRKSLKGVRTQSIMGVPVCVFLGKR